MSHLWLSLALIKFASIKSVEIASWRFSRVLRSEGLFLTLGIEGAFSRHSVDSVSRHGVDSVSRHSVYSVLWLDERLDPVQVAMLRHLLIALLLIGLWLSGPFLSFGTLAPSILNAVQWAVHNQAEEPTADENE